MEVKAYDFGNAIQLYSITDFEIRNIRTESSFIRFQPNSTRKSNPYILNGLKPWAMNKPMSISNHRYCRIIMALHLPFILTYNRSFEFNIPIRVSKTSTM